MAIPPTTSPPRSTPTICPRTWSWHWAATTCGSFDPRSGTHALDVEDPYYGGLTDFEDVFVVIEAALPGLHDWVDARLDGS
jgi:protein-tyrosine-phosphatase